MKKYFIAPLIIVVVAAAAIAWFYYGNKTAVAPESPVPAQKKNAPPSGDKTASVKKGIKRFALTAVANSGVEGDGSITLRSDLSSMAIQLTKAANLTNGDKYEIYLMLKAGGSPTYVGELAAVATGQPKFLWGMAGKTDWYSADKVIVTRRGAKEQQPGKTVAEATIPKTGEVLDK